MSVIKEAADATAFPNRDDKFIFSPSSDFHFPCACCAFNESKPEEACNQCRYYYGGH